MALAGPTTTKGCTQIVSERGRAVELFAWMWAAAFAVMLLGVVTLGW